MVVWSGVDGVVRFWKWLKPSAETPPKSDVKAPSYAKPHGLKRMTKDIKIALRLAQDDPEAYAHWSNLELLEESATARVTIHGPVDTPFEGGRFVVDFSPDDAYPFNPPLAVFRTPIFHPHVSSKSQTKHPEGMFHSKLICRQCYNDYLNHRMYLLRKANAEGRPIHLEPQVHEGYNPTTKLTALIDNVYESLARPDSDIGSNGEALALFTENRDEYNRIAGQWTADFALPDAE